MARKVLFVCTGNTCRSSMAEALAVDIIAYKQMAEEIEVASVGVAAWPGSPASPQAVEALKEQGLDLSGHRAKGLHGDEIKEADLILTMTAAHRDILVSLMPEVGEKTFTLADYAGISGDVPDPFGQPVEIYRECAGFLRKMIEAALDKFAGSV